jgi:hypothetical protein
MSHLLIASTPEEIIDAGSLLVELISSKSAVAAYTVSVRDNWTSVKHPHQFDVMELGRRGGGGGATILPSSPWFLKNQNRRKYTKY